MKNFIKKKEVEHCIIKAQNPRQKKMQSIFKMIFIRVKGRVGDFMRDLAERGTYSLIIQHCLGNNVRGREKVDTEMNIWLVIHN